MNKSHQNCRLCGVQTPTGFVICDSCYVNSVLSDSKTSNCMIGRSKETTSTLTFINQDKE